VCCLSEGTLGPHERYSFGGVKGGGKSTTSGAIGGGYKLKGQRNSS